MFHFEWGLIIPIMAMCIPIVAIVGGIVHGIVQTMGKQKMIELAQRERIAAIERGVDISKLPPLPQFSTGWGDSDNPYFTPQEQARRRSHGLMIGGLVTLAVGLSLCVFLSQIQKNDQTWLVGMIPASVGAALLLSAWLVRPRDDGSSSKLSTGGR